MPAWSDPEQVDPEERRHLQVEGERSLLGQEASGLLLARALIETGQVGQGQVDGVGRHDELVGAAGVSRDTSPQGLVPFNQPIDAPLQGGGIEVALHLQHARVLVGGGAVGDQLVEEPEPFLSRPGHQADSVPRAVGGARTGQALDRRQGRALHRLDRGRQ